MSPVELLRDVICLWLFRLEKSRFFHRIHAQILRNFFETRYFMKIFVCIKQVPDTETKIKIGADGSSIDSNGVKWVMNPYDEYAVEESIKTRDANPGSQIIVVSVGPKKRTVESLRTALAMGADEAIAIDALENIDSLTTAKALATCLQQEGPAGLVLTGKLAIDDNASAVPQMLAEYLKVPHATVVSKFSLSGNQIEVQRDVEGGAKEVLQMSAPAVIAANKGLNMPRYASLPGIMKAKKKVIKELDLTALLQASGSDVVNKNQILRIELPAEKPAAKILSGDMKAQVTQLVQLLRDEAKVL
jgi:electron transfer flavoprotein beta subunit